MIVEFKYNLSKPTTEIENFHMNQRKKVDYFSPNDNQIGFNNCVQNE